MKTLQTMILSGLTAAFSPLALFGYTGWTEDYDGTSDNTLLLYKFDEGSGATTTANIASGANTLGAVSMNYATTNTTTGVEGKFGNAFESNLPSTNTNSAYGQIPNTSLGTSLALSNISVELWYKPLSSDVTPAAVSYLVDYRFNTKGGFQMAFFESSNSFRAYVGNGDALLFSTISVDDMNFVENTWTHLALTYEDGVGLKVYQDGNLVGENLNSDFGSLSEYDCGNLRIGNRVGSSYNSQPGDYDNFRISNVAYDFTAIPEPAQAGVLFGMIGVAMVALNRRRWQRRG